MDGWLGLVKLSPRRTGIGQTFSKMDWANFMQKQEVKSVWGSGWDRSEFLWERHGSEIIKRVPHTHTSSVDLGSQLTNTHTPSSRNVYNMTLLQAAVHQIPSSFNINFQTVCHSESRKKPKWFTVSKHEISGDKQNEFIQRMKLSILVWMVWVGLGCFWHLI